MQNDCIGKVLRKRLHLGILVRFLFYFFMLMFLLLSAFLMNVIAVDGWMEKGSGNKINKQWDENNKHTSIEYSTQIQLIIHHSFVLMHNLYNF
jgi:hypothetical protein